MDEKQRNVSIAQEKQNQLLRLLGVAKVNPGQIQFALIAGHSYINIADIHRLLSELERGTNCEKKKDAYAGLSEYLYELAK